MKIFISWSKNKSKLLAEETKKLIVSTLGKSVEFFFSPEMYKGTRVDHEIHKNLLECDKCLVCITAENYKNPWLLYEAGVVFGSNYSKTATGIVIPVLFEHIPDWSSWIDKPLNQYVPIQLKISNAEFVYGKQDFKNFLVELAKEGNYKLKNFEKSWETYERNIKMILKKEQLIPTECKDLVDRLLETDAGTFTLESPEITSEKITFHKGFATNILTGILLDNIINYQGKRLWVYGRRNKRLLSSDNEKFFAFLANEGIRNGVDFKCLFPFPNTEATEKATNMAKARSFKTDLQTYMENAISLGNKYNLPVEKMFRLYKRRRTKSIIVSDNSILYRHIMCDGDGYPLPYTNTDFEVLSILPTNNTPSRGSMLFEELKNIWEESVPLTEKLYNQIYSE